MSKKIKFRHIGKFRNRLANIVFCLFLSIARQTREEFELDLVDFYYEDKTQW